MRCNPALKEERVRADTGEGRSAGRKGTMRCRYPRGTVMTMQIDEVAPKERSKELLARKREQRSEVTLFSAQAGRKPLVAFAAIPASTELPSTWDSATS